MPIGFFGSPPGWGNTDGELAVYESYGAIRLLKCDANGEPMPDQVLTKRVLRQFSPNWFIPMTKPAVVVFRAWFSATPTLARRTYEREWGGKKYKFLSAAYKSGPILSAASTTIKSFVPGGSVTDGQLCMVTSNMLTEPLRKCVESEFFSPPPPRCLLSHSGQEHIFRFFSTESVLCSGAPSRELYTRGLSCGVGQEIS